jgi:LPS-assembly protein
LSDSLEGGQSLTLGFDYDVSKKDNSTIFKSSLGQIFRDINDDNLPKKTKMQTKRSDIVGEISFFPNKNIDFTYNFSADNDLKSVDYNLIKTEITINNFVTSFDFLEENNEIGQNSYFARKIKYGFDNNNSILFNTRRNRKTDLTEFYNLIYEYKNDCLTASVEYNKNYYEDRDVKPNEELFFSLTLIPFTSVNSPTIK